jgi:hypothetical protein
MELSCHCITRLARADQTVQCNAAGELELRLEMPRREGSAHLVIRPLDFMQRLAVLVRGRGRGYLGGTEFSVLGRFNSPDPGAMHCRLCGRVWPRASGPVDRRFPGMLSWGRSGWSVAIAYGAARRGVVAGRVCPRGTAIPRRVACRSSACKPRRRWQRCVACRQVSPSIALDRDSPRIRQIGGPEGPVDPPAQKWAAGLRLLQLRYSSFPLASAPRIAWIQSAPQRSFRAIGDSGSITRRNGTTLWMVAPSCRSSHAASATTRR